MNVGIGYDIHALKKGRRLLLGGVEIQHTHGLLGHSDGDVLLHAVVDAILGAAGLGDIGEYFPDTDARYKNADSKEFVAGALSALKKKKMKLNQVDATIIAEAPKLAPYKAVVRASVSRVLGIREDRVSIKAKTNEGFGAVGQKKAIACIAVASVQ